MSEYTEYGLDFNLFPKQQLLLAHPDMIPEGYEIPNEVLFGGAAGGGKAICSKELAITPYGEKLWEDVKLGDRLISENGRATKVISMTPWQDEKIYKVSFNDGTTIRVSSGHLWTYWPTSRDSKKLKRAKSIGVEDRLSHCKVATTEQLKEKIDYNNTHYSLDSEGFPKISRIKVPITLPVAFTKSYRVPMRTIPPYVLGVLLGDGCIHDNVITVSDKMPGDTTEFLQYFTEDGSTDFALRTDESMAITGEAKIKMVSNLAKLNLMDTYCDEKFIPECYKLAPIEDRFKLIQGLMDTDGHSGGKDNGGEFSSTSKQLAEDVVWVLRSLGAYASISDEKVGSYKDEEGILVVCKPHWRVYFSAKDQSEFFRLKRKVAGCRKYTRKDRYFGKTITSIEYDGIDKARCVTVDNPNGLFLTTGFTVTHNSYAMRVISIILAIECPGVNVYLFRKTYTELDSNHMLGPQGYRALLSTAVDNKMVRIDSQKNLIQFRNGPTGTFAGGSLIYLRHAQYDKDMYIYQGAEIHVMMIDEATHFSEPIYSFLRARVRTGAWKPPVKWAKWFPRILCSSNPGNTYHNFWKHIFVDFVDPEHPYQPVRAPEDDGGMLRQYIPATVYDNPALLEHDPGYISRLKGLGSPELVRAMLEGDWDIVAGGMFDDLWRRGTHIIEKPFAIPKGWYINRGFDWGSSKPFAALWYAESNGDPVTLANGKEFKFPPGTIVVLDEWYGNDPKAKDPNTGLFMPNVQMGEGIRNREETSFILAPIKDRICPGPADASIYTVMNNDSPAAGINSGYWGTADRAKTDIFFPSDKSKGTRVKRWSLIRNRLSNSHDIKGNNPMEQPALFVFPTCKHLIRTLPTAPRDERNHEDIDSDSEDHLLDTLGYRVLQARSGIGRLRTKIG